MKSWIRCLDIAAIGLCIFLPACAITPLPPGVPLFPPRSAPTVAPLVVHDEVERVRVIGRTKAELWDSLEHERKQNNSLNGGHAATSIQFAWNAQSKSTVDACWIDEARVVLTVKTLLPERVSITLSDPELEASWNRVLDGLRIHEEGHRSIAMRTAEELRAIVKTIAPEPTCEALQKKVDGALAAHVEKAEHVHDEYDRKTQSGVLQGAHFD